MEPNDDMAEMQEAASEYKCREAALKDGYSIEQADNCDDRFFRCSTCPWMENYEKIYQEFWKDLIED